MIGGHAFGIHFSAAHNGAFNTSTENANELTTKSGPDECKALSIRTRLKHLLLLALADHTTDALTRFILQLSLKFLKAGDRGTISNAHTLRHKAADLWRCERTNAVTAAFTLVWVMPSVLREERSRDASVQHLNLRRYELDGTDAQDQRVRERVHALGRIYTICRCRSNQLVASRNLLHQLDYSHDYHTRDTQSERA